MRRARAWIVMAALVTGACVEAPTTQAGPAAGPPCPTPVLPVVADPRPDLSAELPPGFFPPTGPWPELPRVPIVALSTKDARERSLRAWDAATLEKAVGPSDGNREIPGQLRGVLLSEGEGPYAFFGPLGQRPVYFLSDGAGRNFMKSWSRLTLDGRTLALNVAMFAPGEHRKLPLERAIHLVDLEINHGHGDKAADPSFVVTEARVLDGTEVLPIDLAGAAKALDERARAKLSAAKQRASADVKRAEDRLPKGVKRSAGPPAIDRRSAVSWDEARKELTFTYLESWGITHDGPTLTLESECPPGSPCLPRFETTRYTVGFQVGVQQRLSAAGRLLEETTFEPRVKTTPFTSQGHAR